MYSYQRYVPLLMLSDKVVFAQVYITPAQQTGCMGKHFCADCWMCVHVFPYIDKSKLSFQTQSAEHSFFFLDNIIPPNNNKPLPWMQVPKVLVVFKEKLK